MKNTLVGRATYINGDVQEFNDAGSYIQCIREELPYLATSGFRFETLTDDPAMRKAVSDIVYDFYGLENPTRSEKLAEQKPFTLPLANKNMHRVFAYLCKTRGIDRDVVSAFAKAHLVYEDAEYHNAVFVGIDGDGVPRHAHKRSTNSNGKSFRQNVEGSDPKHSFNYTGIDGSLYVFEAPIDLLSYISLYPSNWQAHSYVACCGTSIQPVMEQLRRQDIDSAYLCLDNDAAGQKAAQRMEAELSERGIYAEIVVPTLKDWNDDLRREAQEWTQTSGLSL